MSVIISRKLSRDKKRYYHYIEYGRGKGERVATGVYTFKKPKDPDEVEYNKQQERILKKKKLDLEIELQAEGTGIIPAHKYKNNFLDYYEEYVKKNRKYGNRHLENSLAAFRDFLSGMTPIKPSEITSNLCERFRAYLLDKYSGETPGGYFSRFKKVLKSATSEGYYRMSPAEDLKCKNKPSKIKEILSDEEYLLLKDTPCVNYEVKRAALFSMYTGFRWCDVKTLEWLHIKEDVVLKKQEKTGVWVEVPIKPTAAAQLGSRKRGLVFNLPTQDGANKALNQWVISAGINKHITWHSLRHSFSVIMQNRGGSAQLVAGLLGHTSTQYVHRTYQRYDLKMAKEAKDLMPH